MVVCGNCIYTVLYERTAPDYSCLCIIREEACNYSGLLWIRLFRELKKSGLVFFKDPSGNRHDSLVFAHFIHRLLIKIHKHVFMARPFLSAIFVAEEKFWFAAVMEIISDVSNFIIATCVVSIARIIAKNNRIYEFGPGLYDSHTRLAVNLFLLCF